MKVFTPFFRRFGSEKQREIQETQELHQEVARLHERAPLVEFVETILHHFEVPDELHHAFQNAIFGILMMEEFLHLPEFKPSYSMSEMVEFRQALRRKRHFHDNQDEFFEMVAEGMVGIFEPIIERLPKTDTPSPFTIPLIYSLPEPKRCIQHIYEVLITEGFREKVFVDLSNKLWTNAANASGIADPMEPHRPFIYPTKNKAPLHEVVTDYLSGTPFYNLFTAPVPLRFNEERFSHAHVLGGSGSGKTTLLTNLILHDLQSEEKPAMVVVDSQGDLIDKLAHIPEVAERMVLISPKDIHYPPALNIFDVNRGRLKGYGAVEREQVTAGVIETIDYIFTNLLGADLTAKQGILFRYIARLMLTLPEVFNRPATLLDILNLMDDHEPFMEAIESLPNIQKQFFKRDFIQQGRQKTQFDDTKKQVRYRIQALLENPTLERLFTSPRTKIDLFTELNNGSIILIDTAKDFLKGASGHFGSIWIGLVLQAILERAVIPEHQRKPTFLYIDEAAEYFTTSIDDILTEARKYRCGAVLAHQYLDQASRDLRASLSANTTIKFAAGVSTSDARAIASDMRTDADFILDQPKYHFACHIRNVTPNAVSIPVQGGVLDQQPRLSESEFEEYLARNRERVALPRPIAYDPETTPPPRESREGEGREDPRVITIDEEGNVVEGPDDEMTW